MLSVIFLRWLGTLKVLWTATLLCFSESMVRASRSAATRKSREFRSEEPEVYGSQPPALDSVDSGCARLFWLRPGDSCRPVLETRWSRSGRVVQRALRETNLNTIQERHEQTMGSQPPPRKSVTFGCRFDASLDRAKVNFLRRPDTPLPTSGMLVLQ